MKFGIFDHLDKRGEPLGKMYRDRLTLVEAAEAAGFYSYHIAEHHTTPLGMAPSPNVFLAAVARATSRLRFGPLVYLLPLYHPLRLIEEICMLDQLSDGRLDVGVGRGISPHEVGSYGVDPAESREIFLESLDVVLKGLTRERLDHVGKWHKFSDVPLELDPVQKPHPPLWYGSSNAPGARFAARRGMNFVTLGPSEMAAEFVAHFNDEWANAVAEQAHNESAVTSPLIGAVRLIFLAESDAEAERIAAPAYAHWFNNLAKLWRDHGGTPVTGLIIDDFTDARRMGAAIVGSPETVRAEIAAQTDEIGLNYFVGQIAWGSLTHEQEMRSLELFAPLLTSVN